MRALVLAVLALAACGPKTSPVPDDPADPVGVDDNGGTAPDAAVPPDAEPPPPEWVTAVVNLHNVLVTRSVVQVSPEHLAAAAVMGVAEPLGAVDSKLVSLDPARLEEMLVGFARNSGATEISAGHAAAAMLALLDDPHAALVHVPEMEALMAMSSGAPHVAPGFRVHRAPGGELVVSVVQADGPAAKARMKPGDEIVSVGGVAIASGEDLLAWFGLPPLTQLPVVVRRKGKELTLALVLDAFQPPPVTHTIERGVGLVRILALPVADDPAHDLVGLLRVALKAFDKKKVAGIVIDLRGSLGGHSPAAAVSLFTNAPVLWRHQVADTSVAPVDVPRVGEIWPTEKPMAILVDEETVSAAEMLAFSLQDLDVAYVIGKPSAGGLSGPEGVGLPGDVIALYPDSKVVGVVSGATPPDLAVQPTIVVNNRTAAQVVAGKDPQLDAAIADVKQRTKRGKKAKPKPRSPAAP